MKRTARRARRSVAVILLLMTMVSVAGGTAFAACDPCEVTSYHDSCGHASKCVLVLFGHLEIWWTEEKKCYDGGGGWHWELCGYYYDDQCTITCA